MELSDEALCRRFASQGDAAAFERLVERYQARAYRLAWRLLGDADEAKDLSQEAFLRLYERAASFDGRARFSTWFHRLLVNLCLDRRRQRRGWIGRLLRLEAGDDGAPSLDRGGSAAEDPAQRIERSRAMSRVWAAAARLSAQQRAALVLHVEEDLPASEIAAVLGCSEATVRVHLHRAVSRLRDELARG